MLYFLQRFLKTRIVYHFVAWNKKCIHKRIKEELPCKEKCRSINKLIKKSNNVPNGKISKIHDTLVFDMDIGPQNPEEYFQIYFLRSMRKNTDAESICFLSFYTHRSTFFLRFVRELSLEIYIYPYKETWKTDG